MSKGACPQQVCAPTTSKGAPTNNGQGCTPQQWARVQHQQWGRLCVPTTSGGLYPGYFLTKWTYNVHFKSIAAVLKWKLPPKNEKHYAIVLEIGISMKFSMYWQ